MLNRVVLMGRLTADPELKKTTSDLSVLSFTAAVERTGRFDSGPQLYEQERQQAASSRGFGISGVFCRGQLTEAGTGSGYKELSPNHLFFGSSRRLHRSSRGRGRPPVLIWSERGKVWHVRKRKA